MATLSETVDKELKHVVDQVVDQSIYTAIVRFFFELVRRLRSFFGLKTKPSSYDLI